MGRLVNRLLPPAVAALLAMAVAVPVTWQLAADRPDPPALPPLPTGPPTGDDLRAHLLAQLPESTGSGAVLLELTTDQPADAGLAPGHYRVNLICGLLRRQGREIDELGVRLATSEQTWQLSLPCPSTLLHLDDLIVAPEPAGAVHAGAERRPERLRAYLLLIQLIPVEDGD